MLALFVCSYPTARKALSHNFDAFVPHPPRNASSRLVILQDVQCLSTQAPTMKKATLGRATMPWYMVVFILVFVAVLFFDFEHRQKQR